MSWMDGSQPSTHSRPPRNMGASRKEDVHPGFLVSAPVTAAHLVSMRFNGCSRASCARLSATGIADTGQTRQQRDEPPPAKSAESLDHFHGCPEYSSSIISMGVPNIRPWVPLTFPRVSRSFPPGCPEYSSVGAPNISVGVPKFPPEVSVGVPNSSPNRSRTRSSRVSPRAS